MESARFGERPLVGTEIVSGSERACAQDTFIYCSSLGFWVKVNSSEGWYLDILDMALAWYRFLVPV